MSATKRDGNPANDPMIGKQLGDYTLLRVLATGGMARIYEAEDLRLGRQAAVKVLEQEKLASDASLTKRFQREARAVAALEHESIISLYQFGEQDGIYFLAMKLVRGRDLAQEMKRYRKQGQRIEVERVLPILAQVASALDYAHQNDVIHRDVKPSNILLDKNDKATLTDFGLVLYQSIEATLGTAFGTPRYIAPEQAISSSKAVPQSDTYSLGVILYEALTGETPFTGDNPMEIAMSHVNDAPRPPRELNPDIPVDVERELLRVLEKEPEKRHETARALIESVVHAYRLVPITLHLRPAPTAISSQTMRALKLEPEPVEPPAPTPAPTQAAPRTTPTPLIIAVVAILLVIAVIVVVLLAQGSTL